MKLKLTGYDKVNSWKEFLYRPDSPEDYDRVVNDSRDKIYQNLSLFHFTYQIIKTGKIIWVEEFGML
jgi:hypothetical protein